MSDTLHVVSVCLLIDTLETYLFLRQNFIRDGLLTVVVTYLFFIIAMSKGTQRKGMAGFSQNASFLDLIFTLCLGEYMNGV